MVTQLGKMVPQLINQVVIFGRFRFSVLFCLLLFLNFACGGADGDPGLCKLSCSSAKLAESLDMKIEQISSGAGSISTTCSAGLANSPLPRPSIYRFKVSRKVDDDLLGREPMRTKSDDPIVYADIPAAAIAFNVVTQGGGFYAGGTSLENGELKDTGFEPPEYTGIATPKKEWCTDSCGVITIQAWQSCPSAGETSAGDVILSSGNLGFQVSTSVNTLATLALRPGRSQGEGMEFQHFLESATDRLYHTIGFRGSEGN